MTSSFGGSFGPYPRVPGNGAPVIGDQVKAAVGMCRPTAPANGGCCLAMYGATTDARRLMYAK